MKIRPESIPWILSSSLPSVLLYGFWIFLGSWVALFGFILGVILTVFFLYFFRDPDRSPPGQASSSEQLWVAPADGIITEINQENDQIRIVVFLTVFNVHVNRMPTDGTILNINYQEGQFLPAYTGNLDEKNERNILVCEDRESRRFEVWQIAGLLARRIHCWKNESNSFSRGERFGMISLGSRTDLILPGDVRPDVSLNDTVRGGKSIVARG